MDHTFEYHKKCLSQLCRVCGKRAVTRKDKGKMCTQNSNLILQIFNIDISKDNLDVFPDKLCTQCATFIYNHSKRQSADNLNYDKVMSMIINPDIWRCYDININIDECRVCSLYEEQQKGGRPVRVKCGRPKELHDSKSLSTSIVLPVDDIATIDTPFEGINATQTRVPTESTPKEKVMVTPRISAKKRVLVTTATSPMFNDTSLEYSINQPTPAKLSATEEKVFTRLTKRKLFTSKNETILCKNKRGQPIVLKKLIKPRKPTSDAKAKVVRQRAATMNKLRDSLSGGDTESCNQQQAAELKKFSLHTRENICSMAGIKSKKLCINAKKTLAMKTHVGISWSQLRKTKKFLRQAGIKFENEMNERTAKKEIIGDDLIGEMITLKEKNDSHYSSKLGFRDVQCPCVYTPDLVSFTKTLLDKYEAFNQLEWQNINENEIWLKLGGDHGGGSFKLTLQILNQKHPNSKKNTVVLCAFEGKDNHPNLKNVLSKFRPQIDQLKKCTWKGKQIRIFLCGDYSFLCLLMGLSGHQSHYPCLWCLIKKEDYQVKRCHRTEVRSRKLSQLKLHCRDYMTTGKGKKINASKYFNVIHMPIFNIRIKQTCPPYLHILLGIVKKHHDLLVEKCHQIDLKIADEKATKESYNEDDESVFGKFISSRRKIRNLNRKKTKFQEKLELLQENEDIPLAEMKKKSKIYQDKIKKIHCNIENLQKKSKLSSRSGPVTSHLDRVLQKHHIEVQAYHSHSFVGNHCHKYLQDLVYTDLCQEVATKTSQLTKSTLIRNEAEVIKLEFTTLNARFSAVHKLLSHCDIIPENQIQEIQNKIDSYLSYYRRHIKAKLIPKMHFLEDHCTQFVSYWGHGLSLLGEQGCESVHSTINSLKAKHGGIRNPVNRLLAIIKEHHLITSPDIESHIPEKKTRPKKLE